MKNKSAIAHDDWIQALHDVGFELTSDDPNVLSVSELASLWKCSITQARTLVRKLVAIGRAKQVQVVRHYGANSNRIPAYILIKEGK